MIIDNMAHCLICDESVSYSPGIVICDKCKAAVMKIRKEMEQIPIYQCMDDDNRLYSGLLSED